MKLKRMNILSSVIGFNYSLDIVMLTSGCPSSSVHLDCSICKQVCGLWVSKTVKVQSFKSFNLVCNCLAHGSYLYWRSLRAIRFFADKVKRTIIFRYVCCHQYNIIPDANIQCGDFMPRDKLAQSVAFDSFIFESLING